MKAQIFIFIMYKADKHPLTTDGVDNRYYTIYIQLQFINKQADYSLNQNLKTEESPS